MTYGVNLPLGLVANSTYAAAPWSGLVYPYLIAPGYATSLFEGDLVTIGGGYINIYTADSDEPALGVFWGCTYTDTNGIVQFTKYWPASTNVFVGTQPTANIITDSNTIFTIQCNATTTPTIANCINLNADVDFTIPGNTSTGQSGMALDTNTFTGNPAKPLHIIGFDPIPGNVSGTPYANLLVKLNNLSTSAGASGVH